MRLLQEFKIMVRRDYPAHPPKLYFTHDVNMLLMEEYVEIWVKTISRLYAFIYEHIRLMVSQIYNPTPHKNNPNFFLIFNNSTSKNPSTLLFANDTRIF